MVSHTFVTKANAIYKTSRFTLFQNKVISSLKKTFANVQSSPLPLSNETLVRVSKNHSKIMNHGTCGIIFCEQCILEANRTLSNGQNNIDDGNRRRASARPRKQTAKTRESSSGTSNVSSSPKIEDFECPCPNSRCKKISDSFITVASETFKKYGADSGSFETFCCSQKLVYSKNKNSKS